MPKPSTQEGYSRKQIEVVKSTCLYVATKLGDLLDDVVIVGGLVPSLLIEPDSLPEGEAPHVGTLDLDVGLTIALLQEERYKKLTERLRAAGFEPDVSDKGNPTRQRWQILNGKATVDFLIAPSLETDKGGRIRNIEPDFAAVIVPGLDLAFEDRRQIDLSGVSIMGERASRQIWVCEGGAFVVLKALAFRMRGENKDAYDLYYVLRNHPDGREGIAARLRPMLADSEDAKRAVQFLREDFSDVDGVGPIRTAAFLTGGPDDDIQADVVGFVGELL